MQIAAAVVGTAAATQVIAPYCTDEWQPAHRAGSHPADCATCGGAGTVQHCENRLPEEDEAEMAGNAFMNTYETSDAPGVTEDGPQLSVIGSNGRRLIARWTPEGAWLGGCLIADRADAEYLAAWLTENRPASGPLSEPEARSAPSEGGSEGER